MNNHVTLIKSFAELVRTKGALFSEENGVSEENRSELINKINRIITDINVDNNLGNKNLGNTISEWCEGHLKINQALDDHLLALTRGFTPNQTSQEIEAKNFRDYGNIIINGMRTISSENNQPSEHPENNQPSEHPENS